MAERYYPPVGFHFRVEFGLPGLESNDTRFSEVSGLTQKIGTTTLQEGGLNTYQHRLPQPEQYGNLVLKRGLNVASAVVLWCKAGIEFFQFVPIPVTVSLLNQDGIPLSIWEFVRCYPVQWSVSDLNAMDGKSYVVETLELAYAYHYHQNIPTALPGALNGLF
ncbi:MAG: phage tail protein [Bacteroidota bacterium]